MSRKIVILLTAVLLDTMIGALFTVAAGFSPGTDTVGTDVAGTPTGTYGGATPMLCAGAYTEIRTDELMKTLRSGLAGSWLGGVPDQSSIVDNDVIRPMKVGMDPNVLISSTTYSISVQALEDKDVAVSPDKFQSKVTPIANDGPYAISYGKMACVKESHGNAIDDAKLAKATYALCAIERMTKTPMLETTGDAGEETGRERLTPNDLVEMKRALDKPKVPSGSRRLVLCPNHVNDLFLVSQNSREQYNIDRNTGKISNLYGFQICEYRNNPVYATARKKKTTGAASDTREFQCSFALYAPHMFKATESTKMYFSEAQKDPEYQRNRISFRHHSTCMFKGADAGIVMMNGHAVSELSED